MSQHCHSFYYSWASTVLFRIRMCVWLRASFAGHVSACNDLLTPSHLCFIYVVMGKHVSVADKHKIVGLRDAGLTFYRLAFPCGNKILTRNVCDAV